MDKTEGKTKGYFTRSMAVHTTSKEKLMMEQMSNHREYFLSLMCDKNFPDIRNLVIYLVK